MAKWNSFADFAIDIFKKLLVSLIATLILVIPTFIYSHVFLVALSSFDTDWYGEYWHLVIILFLLAVLEGYLLYKKRSLFPWFVVFTIVLAAAFALYRLHILPEGWPLWPFFCLFLLVLFHLLLIGSFVTWRIVANIMATP
jgi:hypothetical protein